MEKLIIIFKANFSNSESFIDLKTSIDFEPIDYTNNIIALDKRNKKLVYLKFIETSEERKLKIFTTNSKMTDFYQLKIKKNIIATFDRSHVKLSLYDLNKIKDDECFSIKSKIFEKKLLDRNLLYELSSECNYLLMFEKPRSLCAYRISDFSLIANVPTRNKIKNLISNEKFVTVLMENNELASLLIVDPLANEHIGRLDNLNYQ